MEPGSEVNVQSDVAEAGSASDAYIQNRGLLDVTINLIYQAAGGTQAASIEAAQGMFLDVDKIELANNTDVDAAIKYLRLNKVQSAAGFLSNGNDVSKLLAMPGAGGVIRAVNKSSGRTGTAEFRITGAAAQVLSGANESWDIPVDFVNLDGDLNRGDDFSLAITTAASIVDQKAILDLNGLLMRLRGLARFAIAHAGSLATYLTADPAPTGRATLITAIANFFVKRDDLAGSEDDWVGSYEDTILGAGILDKRYGWAVASTAAGAPALVDCYAEIDNIEAGNRTLIVAETQWSRAAGVAWPPPPVKTITAADLAKITYVHNIDPYDTDNFLTFTPTAAATKVGAGNGAYWYLPVNVAVTGNPTQGEDESQFRSRYPSTLDVELPYQAIVNPPWVQADELVGHPDDRWAVFEGAEFFNASFADKRGRWAITTETEGAPTDANQVAALGDIPAGACTFAISAFPRLEPYDSTAIYHLDAETAADYPDGAVFYVQSQSPFEPKKYLKITLTADGTLVGANNAAYIYAAATVEKVGVLDAATKLQLIRTIQPTQLFLRIPAMAITNPTWLDQDGGNATVLVAAFVQKLIVAIEGTTGIWLKRLRKIIQGNNETETLSATRVAVTPAAAGQINIQNLVNGIGQVLFWPPAQTKVGTPFSTADLREFKAGDFLSYGNLEWEIGDTPWTTWQDNVLQANVVLADGYAYDANDVPALNATADFVLEGRDIHLGLVIPAILKRAAQNIGGKGGASGKLWAYVSSASDAAWRRLLDVLKDDANTDVKRADFRAALTTGRLDKDIAGSGALALTAEEASYSLVRLTGALIGDRILSVPANRPAGVLVFRNESTGGHAVKLKVSTQNDAAAITLPANDSIVIHHGGSVARYGS